MTVSEALHSRRAIPFFDTSVQISRTEIDAIVDKASLAPSSMNLEPYSLLLCHSAGDKERLKSVAFSQPKILDASAVLVVVGLMNGHELHAERAAQSNVELGYFPEERKDGWIERAKGGWPTAEKQRDECFRAGGIWSMSFMLAAQEAGWVTAPMGGYAEKALQAEFGLSDNEIPVLIICIGKPDPSRELLPRAARIPASELIHEGNW